MAKFFSILLFIIQLLGAKYFMSTGIFWENPWYGIVSTDELYRNCVVRYSEIFFVVAWISTTILGMILVKKVMRRFENKKNESQMLGAK